MGPMLQLAIKDSKEETSCLSTRYKEAHATPQASHRLMECHRQIGTQLVNLTHGCGAKWKSEHNMLTNMMEGLNMIC